MNKKFSMILGAACLSTALLVGCSDDSASSGPSKAEECAAGITSDCVVGTWNMIGFADIPDEDKNEENKVELLINQDMIFQMSTFSKSFQFSHNLF